jgi:hypothetical protein
MSRRREPTVARVNTVLAVLVASATLQCTARYARIEAIEEQLEGLSPPWVAAHRNTFRSVLESALASDAYVCDPLPRDVFFGATADGARTVRGTMPHYGVYHGPMHYDVIREEGRWRVLVRIAVERPRAQAELELPDCALAPALEGPVRCEGIPYAQSGTLHACPDTGVFSAPATRRNVEALLARWSRDPERYYDRDASAWGLPVHYDFTFAEAGDERRLGGLPHMTVPLDPSCGRTPYFQAMRAGWSMPIVTHEIGHVLGLLDEYEMFSGIVDLYPKTPFEGAERSRMGLSMKEHTVLLPLHHYLILRRYFCPEPVTRDPYEHALHGRG